MKKLIFLLLLHLFICSVANSQKQGNYWCFGDSAGINFNSAIPLPIFTSLDTRGSCVSIADTNGQLLFYANTGATIPGNTAFIRDKSHHLMQGGDSIVGENWYNELLIIPAPDSLSLYYLFSIGITGSSQFGFYYSIIDMSLNGGLGVVTQKNIQLQSFPAVDCIIAIKHGNGRDWWVIFKRSSFPFSNPPNNEWHEYLVTPSSIGNYNVQQIGEPFLGNLGKLCVNPQGNKIAFTHFDGLVETYDFDRCNGIISNAKTIEYPNWPTILYPCNECAFSPSGNNLYVTLTDTFSALMQYNLLDSNPALTRDTLWYYNFPVGGIGAVRRAPDNKLYVSSAYIDSMGSWNYPYPDSVYNMYNMNLGVVNYPDSSGATCDFQPYSFYLGGKRTYWGLPNNPDYDLGRDSGSVCDTIQWTGIKEQQATGKGQLYVTYISSWQKLFVNAQNIKGKNAVLRIYDLNGRVVFSAQRKTQPPPNKTGQAYYTQDVDVSSLSSGMYVVHLITEKEMLSKKFVKN